MPLAGYSQPPWEWLCDEWTSIDTSARHEVCRRSRKPRAAASRLGLTRCSTFPILRAPGRIKEIRFSRLRDEGLDSVDDGVGEVLLEFGIEKKVFLIGENNKSLLGENRRHH